MLQLTQNESFVNAAQDTEPSSKTRQGLTEQSADSPTIGKSIVVWNPWLAWMSLRECMQPEFRLGHLRRRNKLLSQKECLRYQIKKSCLCGSGVGSEPSAWGKHASSARASFKGFITVMIVDLCDSAFYDEPLLSYESVHIPWFVALIKICCITWSVMHPACSSPHLVGNKKEIMDCNETKTTDFRSLGCSHQSSNLMKQKPRYSMAMACSHAAGFGDILDTELLMSESARW